jgi:hypothetical protein
MRYVTFLRFWCEFHRLGEMVDPIERSEESYGGPWTTRTMLTSRTTQIVYSVPNP